jgi:hypothetical protein
MLAPDIRTRIQLLHREVAQLWRQAQCVGSGATVHTLVNRISTARGALCLAEERHVSLAPDRVDVLLALAEASVREARSLLAQTVCSRTASSARTYLGKGAR